MLLDDYLPQYDAVERHEIIVYRPAGEVWEALWETDFARSALIRRLFRLRGLGAGRGLPAPLDLAAIQRWRFAVLDNVPPEYVVLGLVGRFWRPTGELQRVDRQSFMEGSPRGPARAAWSFELEAIEDGVTRLSTETRVHASDDRTRRSFLRYWRLIGPFSALIRREMLRQVERQAAG